MNEINRIKKVHAQINIEITMPILINFATIETRIEIHTLNGVCVFYVNECMCVCMYIDLKVD